MLSEYVMTFKHIHNLITEISTNNMYNMILLCKENIKHINTFAKDIQMVYT